MKQDLIGDMIGYMKYGGAVYENDPEYHLTNASTRLLGAISRDCSADTQYNPQ